MAFENTHLYLAARVQKALTDNSISTIIVQNSDAYRMGAVFPDILFYSKIKRLSDIAYRLHGDDGQPTNRVVFELLERARDEDDALNLAFSLGYLTHCAADIRIHPMVYYLSGFKPQETRREAQRSSYLHWHFETVIDQRLNQSCFLNEMIDPAVVTQLKVIEILGIDVTDFSTALKRMMRYFAMIDKRRFYLLFRLLRRIGLVPGEAVAGFYPNADREKILLPEKISYSDPISGDPRETTLERLADDAIDLSMAMINAAFRFFSGEIDRAECEKWIPGLNLATGWPGKTKTDIRYFGNVRG